MIIGTIRKSVGSCVTCKKLFWWFHHFEIESPLVQLTCFSRLCWNGSEKWDWGPWLPKKSTSISKWKKCFTWEPNLGCVKNKRCFAFKPGDRPFSRSGSHDYQHILMPFYTQNKKYIMHMYNKSQQSKKERWNLFPWKIRHSQTEDIPGVNGTLRQCMGMDFWFDSFTSAWARLRSLLLFTCDPPKKKLDAPTMKLEILCDYPVDAGQTRRIYIHLYVYSAASYVKSGWHWIPTYWS